MVFEDKEKMRTVSKWIIGIFTICVLIYLSLRHIGNITAVLFQFCTLIKPLLIGIMIALILNVPMTAIEERLLKQPRFANIKRPLAMLLSFTLVIGILAGVTVLVIPELIAAVRLIVQIIISALDTLAELDRTVFAEIPTFGSAIAGAEIDWVQLKLQIENWFKAQSIIWVEQGVGLAGSLAGQIVAFFIGLVFAIYMLFSKEKLTAQACRLIRAWLPKQFGETAIHVASVCNTTFRHFIAGQVTEAIILGSLCMLGMMILRIPYAPMVGALIGVTALIPIVGAFIGGAIGAVMIVTVNPLKALVFLVFLVVLQQVEGNVIYPRVVGGKLNLSGLWVLAAVTVGGNLAGPLGMLLAVPAFSAAYTLIKEATVKREQGFER
ncbi:MAG: AI-2E family transporter [Peptococcaceae bacterium]|nr:AI-2E family transporter [Peptococcaceae bacterium]